MALIVLSVLLWVKDTAYIFLLGRGFARGDGFADAVELLATKVKTVEENEAWRKKKQPNY